MPDSSPRPKPIALAELAKALEGRLDGPSPGPSVSGIAPITEAGPDQLTFLTDAKKIARHAQELETTRATAVIAAEGAGALPLPSIRFANPSVGLARALAYFYPEERPPAGIHPTAFVDEEAEVDPTASVGPMAVVEAGARIGPHTLIDAQCSIGRRVMIGSHTHLHPRVTVLADGRIGSHTIIHSGAVLGSDGFGFVTTREGHGKVPQVGIVEIGDRVEIGANVTIDRATMGKTIVGDGTKIDNLVHIAHNVVIGRDCLIVAQVGISGSTVIGDRVTLAGQVGTVGHVTIGHGTTVAARGVVTQDVEPNSLVSGFPIKPHSEEKRILAALRRLPDLLKTVRDLEGRSKKESHP